MKTQVIMWYDKNKDTPRTMGMKLNRKLTSLGIHNPKSVQQMATYLLDDKIKIVYLITW